MEINFQSFFVLSLQSHVTTITTIFNFDEFIFVYVINVRFICHDEIYLLTYAYTVEGKGSDVVIFKNSILTLSLTLYKYASYKQLSHTVQKQPSTTINF